MLRRRLLPAPAVAPSRPERPESPGARASSQRRPPGGRGRARVLGPPPRARDPLRAGSPRGCGPGRQREPHRRAAGRTDRLQAGRLARGGVGGGHGGHAGTSRRRRGGATPGRPRRRDVERVGARARGSAPARAAATPGAGGWRVPAGRAPRPGRRSPSPARPAAAERALARGQASPLATGDGRTLRGEGSGGVSRGGRQSVPKGQRQLPLAHLECK